jgi:hypothetical protein
MSCSGAGSASENGQATTDQASFWPAVVTLPGVICGLRGNRNTTSLTGCDKHQVTIGSAAAAGYGWTPTSMEGRFDFTENAGKVLTDAIGAAVDSGSCAPVLARVIEGDPAGALAPSSWWAAAGPAVSPRRCSARSASTACITRSAPSS